MRVDLTSILPQLPVWTLVFFRLTGLFVVAPLFSSASVPARFRVMWALALSLCIYPVLLDRPATAAMIEPMLHGNLPLWLLPVAIVMELLIGTVIGYGASLPLVGMQLAGQMIDQQVGTGLAGLINPDAGGEQTGVFGDFYFLLATAILLMIGGHRVILSALLDSYQQVPLAGFRPDPRLAGLLVGLLTSMFEMALRVAAPLLCLVFLETVATGFLARTVPQFNLMSVGFPLRIMVGLMILGASLSSAANVCVQGVHRGLWAVMAYMGG